MAITADDAAMATWKPSSIPRPVIVISAGAAAAGAAWKRFRRRSRPDPVHAPGHRHRKAAPNVDDPQLDDVAGDRDQPWVRTTHSDSQQRRFRR
ncbi:MAG: hypothetical protein R2707_17705 [Acidimicrobiales bacterium]